MTNARMKKYETIGCCGIDCGLCPRFHTRSASVCPGCGGPGFKDKHPSCGYLTCCVNKKGLETCSECKDYPCKRFDSEKSGYDSFVTHRKVFENLDFIKNHGMVEFINRQKIRMNILADFLNDYDDGRSKSFFCLSCALLPLEGLHQAHEVIQNLDGSTDKKAKNKQLRELLTKTAGGSKIELKLNKKDNAH